MTSQRIQARRLIRITVAASTVVLAIAGLLVLAAWYSQIPRPIRRGIAESFLRGVLIGYALAWLFAGPGSIGLGWILLKARRRRVLMPGVSRALAVSTSLLFSLILLETSSAAFRAWVGRLPHLPTSFPEPSTSGTLRIVVIGGSSALGEPFRPWLSVGQIVGWKLQEALPDRAVEVEILAKLGASLEDMNKALTKLRSRPDAIVIYSGHNEFVSRFEEERDPDLGEEPGLNLLRPIYRASLRSPFCQLVYSTTSRNRLDEAPPLRNRHRLIDPPVCSPSERAEIVADFDRRLDAIVAWSYRIGSVPILVIPPGNDADFEPSRSVVPPSSTLADRAWIEAGFQDAERTPERASERYRDILSRFPGFAEAHFQLARGLERSGRIAEAAKHYGEARDLDGLPIRAPSDFQEIYRRVAERHHAPLIDGLAVLRNASPTGLLDDHVILDAHHPTLLGQTALAQAILRSLYQKRLFGLLGQAPRLEQSIISDHFGLDNRRWAEICNRTSIHYRRTAGYRFDPRERLRKAERFADASRRFASDEKASFPAISEIGIGY